MKKSLTSLIPTSLNSASMTSIFCVKVTSADMGLNVFSGKTIGGKSIGRRCLYRINRECCACLFA